jgi:Leucine-rich repeat (LRR) protein
MAADWVIEDGVFGRRMVMKSGWSSDALSAAQSLGVRELELNYAKGWADHDYTFLSQLSELETLEITDWNATDVTPIHAVPGLRRLKVFTYCKTAIDFSRFPSVEECSLEWRTNAGSLFEHTGLRKLFINKYPGKDLAAFERVNLESLSLASPKLDTLEGIDALKGLMFLGIYVARRLTSLEGLQRLRRLTRLEINDCPKVGDISPVTDLRGLEELQLCNDGEIETLRPLAGHETLRVFLFYESTNIRDGDLSVLKELPNLEHVAFVDRRHYSHKASDFPRRRMT